MHLENEDMEMNGIQKLGYKVLDLADEDDLTNRGHVCIYVYFFIVCSLHHGKVIGTTFLPSYDYFIGIIVCGS